MNSLFRFSHKISDRLLAFVAALVITCVLMSTAIVPASPAIAYAPMTMGVLA